ncbi:MAG: hypothetical protein K0S60_503 [Evtepia sp.]|jgi:hypothetical protein|nr:hypothetical protein [Evtepia sp.]
MLFRNPPSPHQREWTALMKKEARLQQKRLMEEPSALEQSLTSKIPDRLEDTLTLAFEKAFSLVFSKGNTLIEKTYSKEQQKQEFRANLATAQILQNRKSLQSFSKKARLQSAQHVFVAGMEGSLLGFLGIGLPDIPLFSGVLLRSIYEIAMSYGFEYDSPEEQLFILMVIEGALLRGEGFTFSDLQLNLWIDWGKYPSLSKKEQLKRTSAALSSHLLYLKFIQGIPIIGTIGGISDGLCLKRVTDYAQLKYKRRFLQQGEPPYPVVKLD